MPRKKQIPEKQTSDLLVQMMNDMNAKLHQIHKDVTKNKSDIARIQNEISLGIGNFFLSFRDCFFIFNHITYN